MQFLKKFRGNNCNKIIFFRQTKLQLHIRKSKMEQFDNSISISGTLHREIRPSQFEYLLPNWTGNSIINFISREIGEDWIIITPNEEYSNMETEVEKRIFRQNWNRFVENLAISTGYFSAMFPLFTKF